MTTQEEHARALALVDKAVHDLGEHFENVTIFVSKLDTPDAETGQATFSGIRSAGSWLARYGQVKEWTLYEEERIRQAARRDDP